MTSEMPLHQKDARRGKPSGESLAARLFREIFRFSFFKAVSLLEALAPDRKRLGEALTPGEEAVRFSVKPGFAFPASDISGLRAAADGRVPEMSVTFMGLIGPNGILPDWYNELALERNREKDFAVTAFYDMFHHRMISLFYLAWKKHRFPENYLSGARDRLSRHLFSLIGLGTPGLSGRMGLPEECLLFYSGLLSRTVPSAIAIEAAVEYLADVPARVEPFINRMLPLSEEDRTRIGAANSRLGEDTVCGSYVWENQTKFRVNLGPMHYRRFLDFIPTGSLLRPIFALVRYQAGIEFELEIRVHLKREEVPGCILGSDAPSASRLGWSTWIRHPDFVHAADPHVTFPDHNP
ncbi:type VI secretion system baseplate subunit TssG [Desulfococcus sp.]|uniref:type VI secretion system baseplate subunit TssG n=1 Tax=Desulfococcus sp. TaxID=2025834 RepID=UPI0035937011